MGEYKHNWDEEDMSPEAIASRAVLMPANETSYKQTLRDIRYILSEQKINTKRSIKQILIDIIEV